jgi:hypothetical protein
VKLGECLEAAEDMCGRARSPLTKQKADPRRRSAPASECAGWLDRPNAARHDWDPGTANPGPSFLPGFRLSEGRLDPYAARNRGDDLVDLYCAFADVYEEPPKGL